MFGLELERAPKVWASGFVFRAWVGLGFPKFGLKSVGPCIMTKVMLLDLKQLMKSSPWAFEQIAPGLFRALSLCTAGPALSPGLRGRA